MKGVALLGATGSIGGSTIDVLLRHPDRYRAVAVSAHRDVEGLATAAQRTGASYAVIADPGLHDALALALSTRGLATTPMAGARALAEVAALPEVDIVVAAIVGAAGLESTLAAARAGKRIALANKESVVMSGRLLDRALAEGGGEVVPVDSEHNALYQCLPQGYARDPERHGVARLVLTASGGPFRGRSAAELAAITPDQACAHPNWRMGRKISVDSATLMNKGLEVIEANWLFGLPGSAIEVVVHPQSVIHSLVAYRDGSMLAQLGRPDMRTAIAHALSTPDRIDAGVRPLDLVEVGRLDFERPDTDAFPCLRLAYDALAAGGVAPAVLNAANEVAVDAFLNGRLAFNAIATVVAATLDALGQGAADDLDGVLAADAAARAHAGAAIHARH